MIMIVDDNPDIRAIIRQHVGQARLAEIVVDCADGEQAVKEYRRFRPDWVLMDIKMEGMDGFGAARTILAEFPAAQILFVTNFDDPAMREAARRSGVKGYVTKDRLSELKSFLG